MLLVHSHVTCNGRRAAQLIRLRLTSNFLPCGLIDYCMVAELDNLVLR